MPIKTWITAFVLLSALLPLAAMAQTNPPCTATDKTCLLDTLNATAKTIPEDNWRDQTWREVAKAAAAHGQMSQALEIVPLVKNPDTKAMTIRGIAMAVAALNLDTEARKEIFSSLRTEADKIEHAPSQAIALTYIAMGQAFAGDHKDSMATASSMTNPALRNKAYGEAAEILAERNNLPYVQENLASIDDPGYKDKEKGLVVKKFADIKSFESALVIANDIVNPYEKAQALLYIMNKQSVPDDEETKAPE